MIGADIPVVSESGGGKAEFLVTRTQNGGGPLTVYFQVSGTARPGDYTVKDGSGVTLTDSVTIAAGQSSAVVDITPVDRGYTSGSETPVLALLPGSGYDLASAFSTAQVAIADDDGSFGTGTGPVSASLTLYNPDGSVQASGGSAILGDIIPMVLSFKGDTTGGSFCFQYNASLITISNANGVAIQPGTLITPTTADMMFDVSATTPSDGTPVDDDIDVDWYGDSVTAATVLCSTGREWVALHMEMPAYWKKGIDIDNPQTPATVKVGQQITLDIGLVNRIHG